LLRVDYPEPTRHAVREAPKQQRTIVTHRSGSHASATQVANHPVNQEMSISIEQHDERVQSLPIVREQLASKPSPHTRQHRRVGFDVWLEIKGHGHLSDQDNASVREHRDTTSELF